MSCSRVDELLNMADDRLEPALEQTVRECVREEILNLQGGRRGVQNLLERTRNLIRGAAFSSVRELANNPQVKVSSQSCSTSGCVGSTASTSTCRAVSWRNTKGQCCSWPSLSSYKEEINCQKNSYYLRAKGCVSDRSKAED